LKDWRETTHQNKNPRLTIVTRVFNADHSLACAWLEFQQKKF